VQPLTPSLDVPSAAAAPRRGREHGLDALRVGAFAILIAYHTGMYFVPWPWLVKNPRTSEALTWAMGFFSVWRLPLLFFISGAGTWFNLERRGAGEFLGERATRLMVPLAFGMLVVCPPQTYVERLAAGQHYGSYLEFWATVFTSGPYPHGNLTWIHLWFLPYLFTFSVVGLPLFAWLRGARGRALVDRLAGACERPGRIYLLAVPAVAATLLLAPHWPRTDNLVADWAHFTNSFLAFVVGYVVCGSERFLALVQRRRGELAWAAFAATGAFYALLGTDVLWPLPHPARFAAGTVVECALALTMILALVGFARARVVRSTPALRRANAAVYPFYVIHQTVTVVLGWWWWGWNPPLALKFLALLAGTIAGTWLGYELVRRTRVTRVLFGMRA
jgi:peptidoglycan/LPS O-acetylase OafA/YrhL